MYINIRIYLSKMNAIRFGKLSKYTIKPALLENIFAYTFIGTISGGISYKLSNKTDPISKDEAMFLLLVEY
jgi:hypothetical protein